MGTFIDLISRTILTTFKKCFEAMTCFFNVIRGDSRNGILTIAKA
jgi:hypothetical protein